MIQLPASGATWRQANNGNKFGDITRSKNVDLDKDGYIALARKAMTLYSHDDDNAFRVPLAIVTSISGTPQYNIYVLTADANAGGLFVFDTAADLISAQQTSGTNAPSFGVMSDMIVWNGKVHASGSDSVNALTFGPGQIFPTPQKITGLGAHPHPLCAVEHLNQLAVGDGNVVNTYDISYSLQATLTLPSEYVVTSIRWRHNLLYIGTRHISGGEAKYFIWTGSGSAAQDGYTVPGANWIYSQCEYSGSMALITSMGEILRFNGGGFDTIARLPVYYSPHSWVSNADKSSLIGKVANRGMEAVGEKLYINLDGKIENADGYGVGSYFPDMPSGLWVFDPNNGLHHRASASYKEVQTLTPTSVDSSYLVFSAPHQAQTGDAVRVLSNISPLVYNTVYYAVVDSPNTFRLAATPADALAGRFITLAPGDVSSDKYYLDRYESFGAQQTSSLGALCVLKSNRFRSFFGTNVLFGSGVYDETLTEKGVLCSLGMGRNRGHFISPRVITANVLDTLQRAYVFLKSLRLDTDQIILKFRTQERFGLPVPLARAGNASWTSATTFTVDSAQHDVRAMAQGDEIEIVKGAGAGYLAHITTINSDNPIWSVTIDETMPFTSGSFDFIAQNWMKAAAFTNSNENNSRGFLGQNIEKDARWIELKVELRGREIEIDSVALTNAMKQPL